MCVSVCGSAENSKENTNKRGHGSGSVLCTHIGAVVWVLKKLMDKISLSSKCSQIANMPSAKLATRWVPMKLIILPENARTSWSTQTVKLCVPVTMYVFLKQRLILLKDSIFCKNFKKLQKFEDKRYSPTVRYPSPSFKKLLQIQKTIPKNKAFLHLLLSHSNRHARIRNTRQFRKVNQFKQRLEEVIDHQVSLAFNTDDRSWSLHETRGYWTLSLSFVVVLAEWLG